MTRFARLGLLLLMTGAVASCQTLSKEECQIADWEVIGRNDGAAGYNPQDRFAGHVKACSRIGVAPDQTLWQRGFDQGLRNYCTPMNGLAAGRAGKSYANVCPGNSSEGFLRGYNLGKSAYSKEDEIRGIESSIRSLEYEISRLEKDARKESDRLRLEQIYNDIRSNERRIGDYRRDIDRLRFELDGIEEDMNWFSADAGR